MSATKVSTNATTLSQKAGRRVDCLMANKAPDVPSPIPLSFASRREVHEEIVDRIRHQRGGLIVTVNTSIARQISRGGTPYPRDKVVMWTADGKPLMWIARLEGSPRLERITGADLMLELPRSIARSSPDTPICVLGRGARRPPKSLQGRIRH